MLDESTLVAIYTLIGVFILLSGILYFIKPKFVLRMKINGSYEIQWDKLFAYSSVIGLIFSILILISYDKLKITYEEYKPALPAKNFFIS